MSHIELAFGHLISQIWLATLVHEVLGILAWMCRKVAARAMSAMVTWDVPATNPVGLHVMKENFFMFLLTTVLIMIPQVDSIRRQDCFKETYLTKLFSHPRDSFRFSITLAGGITFWNIIGI